MHISNPIITPRIKQILKGTILGGSSIIKPFKGNNCYLSMRSKNDKWLEYKASELYSFSSPKPFTIEVTNRWHSFCYPCFNEFRNIFYKENTRFVTVESLNDLKDIAFMIWFGDAGKYDGKNVVLNTHVWGEFGTKNIQKYLELAFFNSKIIQDRGRFRLKLDSHSSKSLINLIEPHFPHFFQY